MTTLYNGTSVDKGLIQHNTDTEVKMTFRRYNFKMTLQAMPLQLQDWKDIYS